MKMKRACLSAATAAIFTLSLALLFILTGWTTELPSPIPSATEEILRHVRYLASDELMGRGVDTAGINLARDYIAQEFKKYGLLPGGDNGSYFQRLDAVTGVEIREPSAVSLGKGAQLAVNEEWVPLGFSASGKVEGDLVFVGYGITAKDYGYDDYEGVDVKGKIVLVLRYEPPPKNEKSPFRKAPNYSNHAALRAKLTNAHNHGASGMILADLHPQSPGQKELISTRRTLARNETGLIAAQIRRETVEKRLQAEGVALSELKNRIDRDEKPASIALPSVGVSLQVTLEKITKPTDNVIAILPGSDPKLKEENVVLGAHYDHLGLGYFGTRDPSSEGQVHNGADDNASGTAAVLNLAEKLSRQAERLARTLVFVAFTGEELGLYGSRYYVNHPPFPIRSTKAMINLDMVGRMKDNRVMAAGVDTGKEFRELISQAGQGLQIEMRPGVGRSDHVSFYNQGIPALHFFTGSHPDYHRPSDDWEKLNIEGMVKASDLVLRLVKELAGAKEPITFVRSASSPARPSPTSPHPAPDP